MSKENDIAELLCVGQCARYWHYKTSTGTTRRIPKPSRVRELIAVDTSENYRGLLEPETRERMEGR